MEEVMQKVHVARDGKKFDDANECEKYKKIILDRARYFEVNLGFEPKDGGFQYKNKIYIAVLCAFQCDAYNIAFAYALYYYSLYDNKYLIPNGVRFVPTFTVKEIPNRSFTLADECDKLVLYDGDIEMARLLHEGVEHINCREYFKHEKLYR